VTVKEVLEALAELNPEACTMDGFDEALIGLVYRKLLDPIALYDQQRCIGILERQGLSREEAEEYFYFNCDDAWLGEGTPAFFIFGVGTEDE
jgi:hypothetical protein